MTLGCQKPPQESHTVSPPMLPSSPSALPQFPYLAITCWLFKEGNREVSRRDQICCELCQGEIPGTTTPPLAPSIPSSTSVPRMAQHGARTPQARL